MWVPVLPRPPSPPASAPSAWETSWYLPGFSFASCHMALPLGNGDRLRPPLVQSRLLPAQLWVRAILCAQGEAGGLPGFCLLCGFSGLVQGLDVGHLLWCCSPSSGVLLTLCHLHPLPKGSLIFGCNLGCVCSLDSITYFQYFLCFKTAYTTSLFFMLSSF